MERVKEAAKESNEGGGGDCEKVCSSVLLADANGPTIHSL